MRGRKGTLPDSLAVLCLVTGFALTVAKARIMAFTCDECFNYLLYGHESLHHILTYYDANNHVLDTILSRWCGLVFGVTEFSLRLPSLFGRLIFLLAVWLLARDLIRSRYVRLALVATISFQPFFLDFGALHRGYSLALGLFMMALWAGIRILDGRPFLPRFLLRRRFPGLYRSLHLVVLSILLGLSAATVPVFVNVGVPLCLFLLVMLWFRWGKEGAEGPPSLRERPARRLWILSLAFSLPAVGILILFYARFFPTLKQRVFYVGFPTAWSSFFDMYENVFYYDNGNHFLLPNALIHRLSAFFAYPATSVIVLLLWVLLVGGTFLWARDRRFVFVSTILIAAVGITALEHELLGILYPVNRTGIYFMCLFLFIPFLAFDNLYDRMKAVDFGKRLRRAVILTATGAFLVFFSVQVSKISLNYVALWRPNAGVRPAMEALDRYVEDHVDVRSLPPESVSLDATYWLYQEVQFYKIRLKMDWLAPLGPPDTKVLKPGKHFYILTYDRYQKPPPHTPLTLIADFPKYPMRLYKGRDLPKHLSKEGE